MTRRKKAVDVEAEPVPGETRGDPPPVVVEVLPLPKPVTEAMAEVQILRELQARVAPFVPAVKLGARIADHARDLLADLLEPRRARRR